MPGVWRVVQGRAGPLREYCTSAGRSGPVLILCHELPRDAIGPSDEGLGYPALADRLASECALRVVAGMLRGTGGSGGDFSAEGWLDDVATLVDEEAADGEAVWLVGFGLGAAVALRAATRDPRVRGVASIAGPADLGGWIMHTDQVLARCRRSGVISGAGPGPGGRFPPDVDTWAKEIVDLAPLDAVARLGGRPLLVMHGSEDPEVPAAAARALADAASAGTVDLRIVPGAGHWLRADPRVAATLVGWLERSR